MEQFLTELEPAKVAAAFDLNIRDFLFNFAKLSGVKTVSSPELTWISTGLQLPILNSVLLTNLAPERVSRAISELQAYYKTRQVTMCWCTGPLTHPARLRKYLEARGFTYAMDSPGMVADLQKINGEVSTPINLELIPVETSQTLEKWAYVNQIGYSSSNEVGKAYSDLMLTLGFDQTRVRYYLALLKGEPVASGVVCLSAGIAGIYNVVTLPAARGQGIGGSLVLKMLQEARIVGYRFAALQASPMAFKLYRQLGFEPYCSYERYHWTPPLNENGH